MARGTPKVESQLSLRPGAGSAPFRQRWMELLASLESQRSITAAAKAVGLSYKAAWDAIATMNNLSGTLLVERSVGGRGGGGAQLTRQGRELVQTFRTVRDESERFVARVNRRVKSRADLATLGRMAMITSARNHLAGTVTRVTPGSVNDEIELRLPGGDRIIATITRESTQTLALKKGADAIALIKASWVLIAVGDATGMRLSARNQLRGTVIRVTPGAVNSEVVIALHGGQSLVALATRESVQSLALVPGAEATAIFKASSVIVAVAA